MRLPRGLSGSEMHLTAPPSPAASRPSNSTTSFWPVALIQYCIFTGSMCSSSSLASYSLSFSLPPCGDGAPVSSSSDALLSFLPTAFSLTLYGLVEKLPGPVCCSPPSGREDFSPSAFLFTATCRRPRLPTPVLERLVRVTPGLDLLLPELEGLAALPPPLGFRRP